MATVLGMVEFNGRRHPPDLTEQNASVSSDGRSQGWKLSTLYVIRPSNVLIPSLCKKKKEGEDQGRS